MPRHKSNFPQSSRKRSEKKNHCLVSLLTECYGRFSQHSEVVQLALLFSPNFTAHLIRPFSVVGLESGIIFI